MLHFRFAETWFDNEAARAVFADIAQIGPAATSRDQSFAGAAVRVEAFSA